MAGIVVYLALGVIKISILLFYKRAFGTKQFSLIANSVLAFVVCLTVTSVIVSTVPPHKYRIGLIVFPDTRFLCLAN